MEYTITTNYDGSITISTMYNGFRRHKQYFGYTEQEAKQLFHQWLTELGE